jgi:hypothetical protein
VLLSSFPAPPTTKRKQQSNPPKLTTHPTQSHPSTKREKQGNKLPSLERKLLFACFVAVLVTWMSFASSARELRIDALTMLETHIVMSSVIFRLDFILMICLALTLVVCLSSLMDLTITHMVLVHERTTLCLDALDTAHNLIVVIVSHIGLIFLHEGFTPTLSRDIWTVHIFPVVVHVLIGQMVKCKKQ